MKNYPETTRLPEPGWVVGTGLFLVTVLCACNARVHTEFDPAQSVVPTPSASLEAFSYKAQPVAVSSQVLDEELKFYRIEELEFPSAGDNNQPGSRVTGRYYQSKLDGSKKLVVILPIWGTYTYPSERVAESLISGSKGEANILLVHGETYLFNWAGMRAAQTPEQFERSIDVSVAWITQTIIDMRRWIDWAKTRPEIDAVRIGLVGFSMSAIVGASIIASEPRYSSAVLVMGAADTGEVFAHCTGNAKELREAVLSHLDWSLDQYREVMVRKYEFINASRFAGYFNPAKLLMVDAYFDNCMPKKSRDALWENLGKPERVTYLYTHKYSFLALSPLGLNDMGRRINRFFALQL